ncbi:MAG: pyridoxamine 5'-phosphate oxidase family protein [Planctomycetota bacterium]
MLTDDVQMLIDESVLCWLATCTPQGEPNVSPKEIFAAHDGSVIIANIMSPDSARNIRDNRRACVSFINIFTQRGFKVAGAANVLQPVDDAYADAETALLAMTGGHYPFKTIFRIKAEKVRPIVAPRYRLFPETTEAMQIDSAMHTYGVRPVT